MKHVFSCNHPLNIAFRDKITAGLHTKLTKIDQTNGPRWTSLFHTAIKELSDEHSATHNYPQIPTHLLAAQAAIIWLHVIQGRIHKELWKFLATNNGPKSIKAFWKLASLFWRKRNGKKHGRSPKEKTYLLKAKLDKELTSFRDTLTNLKIPYTPIPIGYRHRVDAKLAWLRWEKSSMHIWQKDKLKAYIQFHHQRHTQLTNNSAHPPQPNTIETDPPPEEKPPYIQP
jgi:hypothetical protein